MQKRIRALAVAPYEGLKALMAKICMEEFPQIDLTVVVGDWKSGLRAAQANLYKDYDIIISRGGTALLPREMMNIPVVEIPLTAYDILRAQQLADNLSDRYAFVGFPNMAENATLLKGILNWKLNVFAYSLPTDTSEVPEELYTLLEDLRSQGYSSILGDNSASSIARQLGLNSVMVTSGVESIREAYHIALQICGSIEKLRSDNNFLRQLLLDQRDRTLVFDQHRALYFSTFDVSGADDVVEMFRSEIPGSSLDSTHRFQKTLNGTLYSVKYRTFHMDSATYTAFHFTTRKLTPPELTGIRHCSPQDLQQAMQSNFYDIVKKSTGLQKAIALADSSRTPMVLTGEYGMEFESAVALIYLNSRLRDTPYIHIDCAQLQSRSWNHLFQYHNSPLNLADRTIFFQNIDVLPPDQLQQLLDYCVSANLSKRNHLVFSCTCPYGSTNTPAGMEIVEHLSSHLIPLPPLRALSGYFPQLVNLCLIWVNSNLPVEIYGMDDEAVQLLKTYNWPRNFKQFRRVLSTLASSAQDQLIRVDAARSLLEEEQVSCSEAPRPLASLTSGRTLEEITKAVVQQTLNEVNGNQTLAAKRLGIGRTTLWRILKKNG